MNNELTLGTQIEHEHTQDDRLAAKIATDHIAEDPHYYTKLMAAGLGDDPQAQEVASNERAYAGQIGTGAEGVAIVKKGATLVTPQPLNVQAPMSYAQRPALKSSNIGAGAPSLKSSNLSPSVPSSNSVSAGKTVPVSPAPSVQGDQGLVNQTTGAKMPHQVKVGNTQKMQGGDVGPLVAKIAAAAVDVADPLEVFGSQIDSLCENRSEYQSLPRWKAAVESKFPKVTYTRQGDVVHAASNGITVARWHDELGGDILSKPSIREGGSSLKKGTATRV